MYFSTAILALSGSAALVSAASVTFQTLDDLTRTIYFTGSADVPSVTVDNTKDYSVTLPDDYIGNFYAVQDGEENTPGMLGEVSFSSWGGMTFFDVSAIVLPTDTNNIKQMWPANSASPTSGCEVFPCNDAYYHPDDVQTKGTDESDIMVSLGSA